MKTIKYFLVVLIATAYIGCGGSTDTTGVDFVEPSAIFTSMCDSPILTFDTLLPSADTRLDPWIESNGEINGTILKWNPIENAVSYWLSINNDTQENIGSAKSVRFLEGVEPDYNITYNSGENEATVSYSSLLADESFTVKVLSYDVHAAATESEDIAVTLSKVYSPAPTKVWADSLNNQINIQWCKVSGASNYNLQYGDDDTQVQTTLDSLDITGLQNNNSYSLAISSNTTKYSESFEATPTENNDTDLDFSIEKVTFNQSVQIDLENNVNNTPSIANKPGVLRVFVNSNSKSENKKVEVKLGGAVNGIPLTPIIKEVILSNTPFNEADSTNKVMYFDINTTQWMQEGTSFYIKIDPNNKVAEENEENNRYPETNMKSFGFENVHKMQIKFVRIETGQGIPTISQELIDKSKAYVKSMYPLSEVIILVDETIVDAKEINVTDDDDNYTSWEKVATKLAVYKLSDTLTLPDVYYYGIIIKDQKGGISGFGHINDLSDSLDKEDLVLGGIGQINVPSIEFFAETLAHELGHIHGREHIQSEDETNDNCMSVEGNDTTFPYHKAEYHYGRMGKTGYNEMEKKLYNKEYYHDMMTYCSKIWISDHNYNAIYEFERQLDILFDRGSTSSIQALSSSVVTDKVKYTDGKLISGSVTKDSKQTDIFTITSRDNTKWKEKISTRPTKYYALVTLNDLRTVEIPFRIYAMSHSTRKNFRFFIPFRNIKKITIQERTKY
ncbi:MAG: hypothetical protein ACI81I_000420 [Arcobacteraceae bacterium]|jgi:hypothetical protein